MKIKNNKGPKIDPWGTPDFIYAGVDSPLPLSILQIIQLWYQSVILYLSTKQYVEPFNVSYSTY